MNHHIKVVPYNPEWPRLFEEEARLLQQALGHNCLAIHHIGSTSVPGLAAKPVIDMMPVVKDILSVDPHRLEPLGYIARGEYGMAFRRYFHKGQEVRTHHVHIWEEHNPEVQKHLLFRKYLRENPEEKERYANLKHHLVRQFQDDPVAYIQGKDDLIKELMNKAGFNGFTLVQALTEKEWEVYYEIRRQEAMSLGIPAPLIEGQNSLLNDEQSFHFVLYQGSTIVSVAHIEMVSDQVAALRSLATHDFHKGKGCATHLLGLLERWVTHQQRTTMQIQAPIGYVAYYKSLGYAEMPSGQSELSYSTTDLGKILGGGENGLTLTYRSATFLL